MYCVVCGEAMPDGGDFCGACGAPRAVSGNRETTSVRWEYCRLSYEFFAKWHLDGLDLDRVTVNTLESGRPFWLLVGDLGRNGWDLCGVGDDSREYWFKRPLSP